MRVRTPIIVLASIGVMLALGGLYVVLDVWVANAEIEAWSQIKYTAEPAAAELPIEVVGQQFEWRIRYPSSRRLQNDPRLAEHFAMETSADQGQADDLPLVNELHLWKGGKVQIHLKSRDVLHSFFVPVLRLKQDAVPGKVTPVWLDAAESNVTWDPEAGDWKQDEQWEFACAEYCGQGHTKMRGPLFVHETKDDFLWLKRAEKVKR